MMQASARDVRYATFRIKTRLNPIHLTLDSLLSGRDFVTENSVLAEIERLIRRDPARRGLIASEDERGPLCPGHLAGAAADLAANGQRVAIISGFFIPAANPPAAETDGPPGAALLAAALASIGITVQLLTDQRCRQAMEVAAEQMNVSRSTVIVPGSSSAEIDHWFEEAASQSTPPLTHVIAIERVGPSHTRESILQNDPDHLDDFEQSVPESDRGRCYNMRGHCLDEYTSPLHRLFELAGESGSAKTIGIGDGGNEIGMGSIPWHELRCRLNNESAARIPCRIQTNWTIVAGVSNWGGMALAAATLLLGNCQNNLTSWTSQQQQQALERLVQHGPAVDGITKLPEATVDGLPFLTYIQPWEGIRRVIGL